MCVSDVKTMLWSERARVLREVEIFEAMMRHLRTRVPGRHRYCRLSRDKEVQGDLKLCGTLELVVRKGRDLACQLAKELADTFAETFRKPSEVAFFMDLVWVAKADFFNHLRETENWV